MTSSQAESLMLSLKDSESCWWHQPPTNHLPTTWTVKNWLWLMYSFFHLASSLPIVMPNKFSGQFLCKGFESRMRFEPRTSGKHKTESPFTWLILWKDMMEICSSSQKRGRSWSLYRLNILSFYWQLKADLMTYVAVKSIVPPPKVPEMVQIHG